MKKELAMIWKEVVVNKSRNYTDIYLEEVQKIERNISSHDSQCPARNTIWHFLNKDTAKPTRRCVRYWDF